MVQEDLRDNRGALIVLETEPRRDVLIAPDRRSAARAPIAEYLAQIADCPPDVDPPLILQLPVKVRVRGAIGRKPVAGRPELPPVEVPERPLEHLVRFLPVEGPPGVPPLLIGPEQNAQ